MFFLALLWISAAPQVIEIQRMEIFFPPADDPYQRIIGIIDGAEESILLQAYQLTNKTVAEALLRAHKRGVRVILLVDKTQARRFEAPKLAALGMDVWIDYIPRIAHSKIMIVDRKTIVGGSFNYSVNALKNAENCTFFENEPKLALEYTHNFYARLAVSKKLDAYLAMKDAKKKL